jgi:hypothetical protein
VPIASCPIDATSRWRHGGRGNALPQCTGAHEDLKRIYVPKINDFSGLSAQVSS